MKARIFFIVIVIIFSCSLSSAQTGRRLLTKAQFDSVKTELNSLPDTDQTKKFLAFFHDLILIDGHKEYVSMNGPAAKAIKNSINDVALYATNLEKSVANIEVVVSGDETPVKVEEVTVITVSASELAMQEIKKSVAARRAAQK